MIRATSRAVTTVIESTANGTCNLVEGAEDLIDGGRDEIDNFLQDLRVEHVIQARERQKQLGAKKFNAAELAYVSKTRRFR